MLRLLADGFAQGDIAGQLVHLGAELIDRPFVPGFGGHAGEGHYNSSGARAAGAVGAGAGAGTRQRGAEGRFESAEKVFGFADRVIPGVNWRRYEQYGRQERSLRRYPSEQRFHGALSLAVSRLIASHDQPG